VSIVTPGPTLPWSTTTVTGFYIPRGILWDGSSIWVTDSFEDTLLRLDANGAVMQTVPVGVHPYYMCFDGQNIWVANSVSSTVSVVNAATGSLVATLTGNGLHQPISVAFDGQRILVPNNLGPNASVSLWRAADLSPLGTVPMGTHIPYAAASDGVDFWITLQDVGGLVRF
jgi:YVTN family beta-propeller protein